MDNPFEFELEDLARVNPNGQDVAKIRAHLNKNKELAKALLVLVKLNPAVASEVAEKMCDIFKHPYDKANIHYTLNILKSLNIVAMVRIKDINILPKELEVVIKLKHKKYMEKIPAAFKNNYSYKSNMKYFWVTEFGEQFIEFCYNHVLNIGGESWNQ